MKNILVYGDSNAWGYDSARYITEHIWEKIEVEPMNVVIVNGEKVGA